MNPDNNSNSNNNTDNYNNLNSSQPAYSLEYHQEILRYIQQNSKSDAEIGFYWQRYYESLSLADRKLIWEHSQKQPNKTIYQTPDNSDAYNKDFSESVGAKIQDIYRENKFTAFIKDRFRGYKKQESVLDSRGSTRRENYKSVVFGLVIGLLFFIGYEFLFNNQYYVRAIIQPPSIETSSPIIISPGGNKVSSENVIVIPKVNIQAPVDYSQLKRQENENSRQFEKRMQDALRHGVVHYPRTQLPGEYVSEDYNSNVVIFGHSAVNIFAPGSFKSIFSRLHDLEKDDFIILNYNQVQYVYKVYDIYDVQPTEVARVVGSASQSHTLTLFTCTPLGSSARRLIIVAKQITPTPSREVIANPPVEFDDLEALPSDSPSFIDILRD